MLFVVLVAAVLLLLLLPLLVVPVLRCAAMEAAVADRTSLWKPGSGSVM
jgi:hypothetical protein